MKLSVYARQIGVTSKTAYRWWRAGRLDASQVDTGTVIVRDPIPKSATGVALYARVSWVDQKNELERHMERRERIRPPRTASMSCAWCKQLAAAANFSRPKFLKLLGFPDHWRHRSATAGPGHALRFHIDRTAFSSAWNRSCNRRLHVRACNPEQALALANWRKDEMRKVRQLLDCERRVARGDYACFARGDSALRELEQEAQWNGLVLEGKWDGQHLVYTIEQMSPQEHAAFLTEEQERLLEDLKWKDSEGSIEP